MPRHDWPGHARFGLAIPSATSATSATAHSLMYGLVRGRRAIVAPDSAVDPDRRRSPDPASCSYHRWVTACARSWAKRRSDGRDGPRRRPAGHRASPQESGEANMRLTGSSGAADRRRVATDRRRAVLDWASKGWVHPPAPTSPGASPRRYAAAPLTSRVRALRWVVGEYRLRREHHHSIAARSTLGASRGTG
jgi:hypothetical protein